MTRHIVELDETYLAPEESDTEAADRTATDYTAALGSTDI